MAIELCFICDEPTGGAGRLDDSLYDNDGRGPYCEECYEPVAEMDEAEDDDGDRHYTQPWFGP